MFLNPVFLYFIWTVNVRPWIHLCSLFSRTITPWNHCSISHSQMKTRSLLNAIKMPALQSDTSHFFFCCPSGANPFFLFTPCLTHWLIKDYQCYLRIVRAQKCAIWSYSQLRYRSDKPSGSLSPGKTSKTTFHQLIVTQPRVHHNNLF